MHSLQTFAAINRLNPVQLVNVDAHSNGYLVGINLRKIAGQKNQGDNLAWNLSIYASQTGIIAPDYLIYNADFPEATFEFEYPITLTRRFINRLYHTYFGYMGTFPAVPYICLVAQLTVTGMANDPVVDYVYRLRLDTIPIMRYQKNEG